MRWYEKMNKGMALMKEACSENDSWNKCWSCPFNSICTKLEDTAWAEVNAGKDIAFAEYIPNNWEVEEEPKK